MKRKLFNTLLTLAGAVTLLTGCASSKDATSQAEKNPANPR